MNMRNNKIYIACIVLISLFMMVLTSAAQTDSAGNVFVSDNDPSLQVVNRDLYWIGGTRGFNGYQIGKSFIAAGRDIAVNDSEIGGSLRAASFNLTLNGVDVTDNITAAGYSLQLSGVTASGVYLAGYNVYFNGTADLANLAGRTVTLDGEINGDADVYGEKIVLGENLSVDGVLTVRSEKEPVLPSGAKVGQFIFNKTETIDDPEDVAELVAEKVTVKPTETVTEKVSEIVTISVSEKVEVKRSNSGFGGFIRGLFGTLLLAALICLLLGGDELRKPGEMLLSRPFPMLGSGFAGLFVIPGMILILLLIRIGSSCAGLLALLFLVVCIYSLIFTGMTLAKTLLPKFTDNKILTNDYVCSLIGALVFWLLRKIPVVGGILQAAAIIYTLGYFIQSVFLRVRNSRPAKTKGSLNDSVQNDVLEPVGSTNSAEQRVEPAEALTTIDVPETSPVAETENADEKTAEVPSDSGSADENLPEPQPQDNPDKND